MECILVITATAFFLRKGHFKTNLKIYNWWNLMCLAVEGNERLGLILLSLAPSFLINALCLLGSLSPKWSSCCSHCLSRAARLQRDFHWEQALMQMIFGRLGKSPCSLCSGFCARESWQPHLDSQLRLCQDPGHVGSADSLQNALGLGLGSTGEPEGQQAGGPLP